jgi:hypothetical protein
MAKAVKSIIPGNEWASFLQAFSGRHAGWLVSMQTHDLETDETVESRFERLESIALDLEDPNNSRINVILRDGNKVFKHILFRPSSLVQEFNHEHNEAALRITTVNTVTTVRLRVAVAPDAIDGVA